MSESPRVFGEFFVQHLSFFFKLVVLLAECVLPFVRGLAAGRPVQSVLVVPTHPFPGFPPSSSRLVCLADCSPENLGQFKQSFKRLFRRLKGCRRLYTRFDKLDAMFSGFLKPARR